MANINKIRLSGTTYNIEDAALKGDIYINSSNRNSIQSVIKEGVYSLSSDDVYSISGTKTNATDRIKGLIIVDNTSYNFTGSTSSDVEGVSALAGIVTFDLSTNFSISLVDRDTNHINELFIEAFTSSGDESPLLDITITHNPSIGVNKIDYVATLYTEFVHEKYALARDLNSKQDTLVSGTNIKTINNQSILGSGNITISGSGSGASVVEVTQAQYDALVSGGTLDLTTLYIITDATEIDISNYWTSAQTQSAIAAAVSGKADSSAVTEEISAAVSGKQDTLVSGTNIKTINNESILGSGNIVIQGGGGKAIEAGRGISVTSGETADTVSFNLPISAGSQSNSVVVNYDGNSASGWMSFAQGRYTYANNQYESAFGNYNRSLNSSSSFGVSGNTLFAVGNGEGQSTRHNSFEIRQNGDIYIADTNDTSTTNYWEKPMIKLQDKLSSLDSTIGDINTILQSI